MTVTQRFWIPAGIVLLALLAARAQFALNAREPSPKTDQTAKPKMQCPMMAGMKGMKVFADGPAVLLSRAGELRLTNKQKQQLADIREKARQRARNVLTAEQQKMLKGTPRGPLSMMDLAMMRMKTMKKPHGMMCPMCMKMMKMKLMKEKKTRSGKRKP